MSLRISDVEELVDCCSILGVVEELARIASEKADELRVPLMSKREETQAADCDELAARLLNIALWMKERVAKDGCEL